MTHAIGNLATVSAELPGTMPTSGRYGWYQDHEGNEWQRVSKLIKKVETDTYNLDQWKLRQVAEGLAIRDDLVLAVKAMGRPGPAGWSAADKQKLNGIAKDAATAAKERDGARRGTAFHDLTERLDRGEDIESVAKGLPAGVGLMVRAYDFLRKNNDWRNVEIERTVVNDEVQAGGTFDRIEHIPSFGEMLGPWECQHGHLHAGDESKFVTDVKSEAEPWRNGLHIGPQLAIYSRAKRMWIPIGGTVQVGDKQLPAGKYVPTPCVRQDIAIVVHVTDGAANPLLLNLEPGWRLALRARAQADDEAASKKSLGAKGAWFAEMPGVVRPAPAQTLVEHAAATQPASVTAPRLVGRDIIAGKVPGDVGDTLYAGSEGTWEAHRDADGTVRWHPVAPSAPPGPVVTVSAAAHDALTAAAAAAAAPEIAAMGNPVAEAAAQAHAAAAADGRVAVAVDAPPAQNGWVDTVDQQAIENVWAARELSDLAETFRIYTEVVGRQWGGRVAEAAEARRRQIECVQRQLHTPRGNAKVKCACGWTSDIPA